MSPEETEFQITLPSNASMGLYPSNKPQLYRTELATPLNLVGKWEMAIVDIQIPHKWHTIPDQFAFSLYVVPPQAREFVTVEIYMDPGYFPTVQSILDAMCREINEEIKRPQRDYEITGKVIAVHDVSCDRIDFKYEGAAESFSIGFPKPSPFLRMLGFSKTDDAEWTHVFPFTTRYPTYVDHISSVFIYSDIVKHQLVGDSSAQLIGIAPVKSSHKDLIYWAFNPILYRPLCKNYIKDVEVQLCSSDGKLLPILQGNTIVRLHFRKV